MVDVVDTAQNNPNPGDHVMPVQLPDIPTRMVHVIPSGEVWIVVEVVLLGEQNNPNSGDHAIEVNPADDEPALRVQVMPLGAERFVQVIPSGEVADDDESYATVQNIKPFHAMENQLADDGRVRAVQVIPSGEV